MVTVYETIVFKYFKNFAVQQNQQITTGLKNSTSVMLLHHSNKIFLNTDIRLQKDIFNIWQRLINGSAHSLSLFWAHRWICFSFPCICKEPCRLSSSQWNVNGSNLCHLYACPLGPPVCDHPRLLFCGNIDTLEVLL